MEKKIMSKQPVCKTRHHSFHFIFNNQNVLITETYRFEHLYVYYKQITYYFITNDCHYK